jgi:hypothetical protein
MADLTRAVWRKSTHSCASTCVEVAVVDGLVAVRDSKDPSGPALFFSSVEWRAFLAGVHDHEFELSDG